MSNHSQPWIIILMDNFNMGLKTMKTVIFTSWRTGLKQYLEVNTKTVSKRFIHSSWLGFAYKCIHKENLTFLIFILNWLTHSSPSTFSEHLMYNISYCLNKSIDISYNSYFFPYQEHIKYICVHTYMHAHRYNHTNNCTYMCIYVKGFLSISEVSSLPSHTSHPTILNISLVSALVFRYHHRIPQSFLHFYSISFHKVLRVSVTTLLLTSWVLSVHILLTGIQDVVFKHSFCILKRRKNTAVFEEAFHSL